MLLLQNMHVLFVLHTELFTTLFKQSTEEAVLIELPSLFHSNIEETIGLHL